MNSSEFIQKLKEFIVGGDVVWVEFGFNIGEENSRIKSLILHKNIVSFLINRISIELNN